VKFIMPASITDVKLNPSFGRMSKPTFWEI